MTFKGSGFLGFGGSGGGGTPAAPVNYNDFENALIFWDGKVDPTGSTLKNPATRIGVTSGTPYDAANDRWGVNPNRGLRWQTPSIDPRNFALCLRLEQSQHAWACTVFWGSTTATISNDGSIRSATGAMGAWIGRPVSATGDGYDTSGWNIFLVSSADETNKPSIDNFTVSGGATKAPGGGSSPKAHVQIDSAVLDNGPHDFIFNVFEKTVTLFINGTQYAQWTLTDDQEVSGRGPYLGIAGDSGNVSSKILNLYEFVAVYPAKALP